jgi:tetratricopeptide (TPR) repeat protein
MYEDIEIMGRILDRVLDLPRYSPVTVPNSPAASFGGFGGLQGGTGFSGAMGLPGGAMPGTGGALGGAGLQLGALGGSGFSGTSTIGGVASVRVPVFPRTQGIYVKDYGVVLSVVLPPQRAPRPASSASEPKPLTEWERIKKQLHGEKPEAAPPPKREQPAIADMVLEAIANNGHHFSQLGDKESLTVSIVFRRENRANSGTAGDPLAGPEGQIYSFFTGVSGNLDPGKPEDAPSASGAGPAAPVVNSPAPGAATGSPADKGSSPRDYELLGDLHMKQGLGKEALRAYQKAAEQNPDSQQAAAIYLKIAQLYLSAEKNETQARQAMDRARELLTRFQVGGPNTRDVSGTKNDSSKSGGAPSALPSRLIITVSKALLFDAGTGKITLEEFKKRATIDYLSFAPAKK